MGGTVRIIVDMDERRMMQGRSDGGRAATGSASGLRRPLGSINMAYCIAVCSVCIGASANASASAVQCEYQDAAVDTAV